MLSGGPGRRRSTRDGLRAVVAAGELPDSVTLDRVVYTRHGVDGSEGATERYPFEIDGDTRKPLSELPFELNLPK